MAAATRTEIMGDRMDNPIQAALEEVLDPLAERVSSLRIEPTGDDWRMTVSYSLYVECHPGESVALDGHTIRMEGEAPEGVEVRGTRRWPDSRHELPAASEETVVGWLHGISGLGTLDVATFRADGEVRAVVAKTHAGSEEERAAWLRRIR